MTIKRSVAIAMSVLLALSSTASPAQEFDVTGFAGISSQSFWQTEQFDGQANGSLASLQTQLELYWRSASGRQRVNVTGFGRFDSEDDRRTHADLREAHWGYEGDGWDLRLGISKVFWGVTESLHLIDVINQTDLVEDIDQEDKLGQPMVNLNLHRDFGRLELFWLPRFRERTFPGTDGRLRSPLPVNDGAAIYESDEGDGHDDFAVRYSHYVGDVDFGVYYFDGTSREPVFQLAESGTELVPYYELMEQFGADVQFTRGAWLLKLEALHRKTNRESFAAGVAGLEYTLFGVSDSAADIGLLFEYLYDDRGPNAAPTAFDDDVFVGARLAFNDAADTSVLAGAAVDRRTHARFVSIEAERRFRDNITTELRLRAFSNAEPQDLLSSMAQDDYLQLSANWFF